MAAPIPITACPEETPAGGDSSARIKARGRRGVHFARMPEPEVREVLYALIPAREVRAPRS